MSDTTTTPLPTPAATRPDGLWLDDLETGATYRTGTYELTAENIVAFAREFDPQPFHLDAEAARGTFFDGLVASGWHTAAVTMRLIATSDAVFATGIVGAGGEVGWPSAAVPGDVLHVELTIGEIRRSASRPNRATVDVAHQTVNQHGEVRQRTSARLLAWDRPEA